MAPMNRLRRPEILWGVLLGVVGIIAAWGLQAIVGGRLPLDPLPLALTPAAILRSLREGFIYFDARSPLLHVLYTVALGMAAGGLSSRQTGTARDARLMARVAVGLGILVVAVREIDAFTVALYYAISAFVSLMIGAFAAEKTARYLVRRRATSLSQLK